MTPTDWTFEDPKEPGIYAIIYSYDPDEGSFSGYDIWDGAKWESRDPTYGYAGPFESIEDAEKWSEEHAPDW